jgi:hypothetical protein
MFSGGFSKRPAAGCARAMLVPPVDTKRAARAAIRMMDISQLTEEPTREGWLAPNRSLLLPSRSLSRGPHQSERLSRDELWEGMVNRTLPQRQEASSCGGGATAMLVSAVAEEVAKNAFSVPVEAFC